MNCDFCGHEFDLVQGRSGCNGCPMGGNCGKLKCPQCNYENVVMPPKPKWLESISKLFLKKAIVKKQSSWEGGK